MAEGNSKAETVEVKKRRLRTALRQARTEIDMTQRAAADGLVWSVSKIVRIEQGTVPVAPSDVRVMLHLYGVGDESKVEGLVELAKQAREDKGWSEFDDVLSQESLELFGNEPAARVIFKYEPSVVPGMFQTQEYARALLRALGNSDREVGRRLEVRTRRQQLLESSRRPEFNFIIGETALARPAGGPEVMREQIAHLQELNEEDGISISVLPLAAGVHRGMGSAFTVLQFDDPLLPDLLYLEDAEEESTSRDEEGKIRSHLELFNDLQEMAAKYGSLSENLERIRRERYDQHDGDR